MKRRDISITTGAAVRALHARFDTEMAAINLILDRIDERTSRPGASGRPQERRWHPKSLRRRPEGEGLHSAIRGPRAYMLCLRLRAHAAVLTRRPGCAEYQDDLYAVNSARLRALGVIRPDASSATVGFGQGADALVREVRVWHRTFRNGRGISLFLCPICDGKAQLLKLHDGRPQCRNCLKGRGIQFRIAYGTRLERAEARTSRIEKLRVKLAAGALRLDGRGLARRRELELSLRRALIREREGFLEIDR